LTFTTPSDQKPQEIFLYVAVASIFLLISIPIIYILNSRFSSFRASLIFVSILMICISIPIFSTFQKTISAFSVCSTHRLSSYILVDYASFIIAGIGCFVVIIKSLVQSSTLPILDMSGFFIIALIPIYHP